MKGHDAAQALAEETPAERIPDHPLIPRNKPAPITTADELAELVRHVREAGSFAFDTEFIGEETYYPWICLVQIGTADRVALVDPLPGPDRDALDLTPVWELIVDPAVETIVHAGAQDLEPAARLLGRAPANIFDTQIAAGFVGRPYPLGLRRLVQELAGIRLGKALTFTQWDRRPLSDVHLRYATDDVRYLPAAREALRAELEAYGHTAWAAAECATLSELDRYGFDPDSRVAKLVGNRSLKPRTVAALREILILRDEIARCEDTPPRTVLKDDVVLRVAKEHVKSVDRLLAIKGLPRPFAERHGRAVIEATARAMEGPPPKRAEYQLPEERPIDSVRIDSLWSLASTFALGRGVAPALLGNRRRVAELYFARRAGRTPEGPLVEGWRDEIGGSVLCQMMSGEDRVVVRWVDGRMETTVNGGGPANSRDSPE